MKNIKTFENFLITELNAETYFSASNKMKKYSETKAGILSKYGKDVYLKNLEKEKNEQYYALIDIDTFLKSRNINNIHPILLDIEKYYYNEKKGTGHNKLYFIDGAGMNKKSINITLSEKDKYAFNIKSNDVIYITPMLKDYINFNNYVKKLNIPEEIYNTTGIYNVSNLNTGYYFNKLPRKLAMALFNASFVIKDDDLTWRDLWNGID